MKKMTAFLYLFLTFLPAFAEETRVKIAVIDTGIEITEKTKPYLCKGEHYDLTGKDDTSRSHGTNIAGIIAKRINPKTHCILDIKYYKSGMVFTDNFTNTLKGFEIALKENVKYVNYSSSGESDPNSKLMEQEYEVIKRLIEKKIFVVVAAGNGLLFSYGKELSLTKCNIFPACHKFDIPFFRVVGNGHSNENRDSDSNYGEKVTDWRNGRKVEGFGYKMSGTSQSTAILTGELAGKNNVKSKD